MQGLIKSCTKESSDITHTFKWRCQFIRVQVILSFTKMTLGTFYMLIDDSRLCRPLEMTTPPAPDYVLLPINVQWLVVFLNALLLYALG